MGGPSRQEKELQAEQAAATKQYMAQQSTNYAEQQDLFAQLKPMLDKEINNPTGFSADELAQLNASNVNTTGAQYANVQKQMNLRNASQNMAGLTSGVAAGETAALQGMAAGTTATNASNIQLQSAQLAQQKAQNAQSELMALEANAGGQAVSMGQVSNTAESQAFQQAQTMQEQSSQMMNSILGGVMGAGASFMSGGMSSMMGGCWIAAAVYGDWDDPRVHRIREVIFKEYRFGVWVAKLYLAYGERIASVVKRSRILKAGLRFAFDRIK